MQLRQIECFLAVAEELNFSRAAKRLRLSQPPLSKQIKQLETQLGVQLFVRDRHSVALTPAGIVYREHIQPLMELMERASMAARRAQTGQTGELRIGFLSALFYDFVPPLLLQYRQLYPDVLVTILEMVPSAQTEALVEKKIDVSFPGLAPGRFGTELESRVVRADPWYVCLHVGHELASQSTLSLAQLRSQNFVFIQSAMSPSMNDLILRIFNQAGYLPKIVQTTSRAQGVMTLIAAGVGISLLPKAVSQLPSTGLVFVPLTDEVPPYEHALVWNPSNMSPVLQSFLAYQAKFGLSF